MELSLTKSIQQQQQMRDLSYSTLERRIAIWEKSANGIKKIKHAMKIQTIKFIETIWSILNIENLHFSNNLNVNDVVIKVLLVLLV